jgi:hypothetical protein
MQGLWGLIMKFFKLRWIFAFGLLNVWVYAQSVALIELTRSAESGDSEAQFKLGLAYANGDGVEKDSSKAFAWYMKAAEKGVTNAEYWIGYMLRSGIGVSENKTEAVKWLKKAAAKGNDNAQFILSDDEAKLKILIEAKEAKEKWATTEFSLILKKDHGIIDTNLDSQVGLATFLKAGEQLKEFWLLKKDEFETIAEFQDRKNPEIKKFEKLVSSKIFINFSAESRYNADESILSAEIPAFSPLSLNNRKFKAVVHTGIFPDDFLASNSSRLVTIKIPKDSARSLKSNLEWAFVCRISSDSINQPPVDESGNIATSIRNPNTESINIPFAPIEAILFSKVDGKVYSRIEFALVPKEARKDSSRNTKPQLRAGIFADNKFGTMNISPTAVDPRWYSHGVYLQRMLETIQVAWDRLLLNNSAYPPSGTTVTVRLKINSAGKIPVIIEVQNTSNQLGKTMCIQAITARSSYGEWSKEMLDNLGSSQEMTLAFYYQ